MLTFRECMERMLDVTGRKRLLVPLPLGVATLQASVLGSCPTRC